jgi:hypothetical protein
MRCSTPICHFFPVLLTAILLAVTGMSWLARRL